MNKRGKIFAVLTAVVGGVAVVLILSPYCAIGIITGCLAIVFFGVAITETN